MTKSLMIPMKPQYAVNVLNGDKTLELRTWIPKDYVGWVYVYVTKGKKDILYKYKDKYYTQHYLTFTDDVETLNGKVVFRFWFDEYITYKYDEDDNTYFATRPQDYGYHAEEVFKRLYLSLDEFKTYSKGKNLYAWHIKQLEVFDTPKELSDFYIAPHFKLNNFTTENIDGFDEWLRIKNAPKKSTWVYTKVLEND